MTPTNYTLHELDRYELAQAVLAVVYAISVNGKRAPEYFPEEMFPDIDAQILKAKDILTAQMLSLPAQERGHVGAQALKNVLDALVQALDAKENVQ